MSNEKVPANSYVEVDSILFTGTSQSLFTYAVPNDMQIAIGEIVRIQFGKHTTLGVVRRLRNTPPSDIPVSSIKPIIEKLDLPCPLPDSLLELADWLREYYVSSTRAVWSTLLPSGLAAKVRTKEVVQTFEPEPLNILNTDQAKLVKKIRPGQKYLIQGVTGSGKTEVYMQVIQNTLGRKKSALVLVPEIMLTTQLRDRLQRHFPTVVSLHSGLTPAIRKRLWVDVLRRTSSGESIVILGARSALFAPIANLGVVIVDEEHEPSYKQESSPRYEAQAVAAKLADLTNSTLILGSATPSVRSRFLADRDRLKLLVLSQRHNSSLPTIQLVEKPKGRETFGPELHSAINQALAKSEQVLLFLNRRGSAHGLSCEACGLAVRCPSCSISLSFHADIVRLVCHYCGYSIMPPSHCQACNSTELRFFGSGTKKLETEINRLWPGATLARIDRDNSDWQYLQETYTNFRDGKIDILLGTQMISRGLDVAGLSTVGIVDADQSLNTSDFSAFERTFQLVSQAAGRAGRRKQAGLVFVQTRNPDNSVLQAAANHDYEAFYQAELIARKQHTYPPFTYLVKLQRNYKSKSLGMKATTKLAAELKQTFAGKIFGPIEYARRSTLGHYQFGILLKSSQRKSLQAIITHLPSGWVADLDPL